MGRPRHSLKLLREFSQFARQNKAWWLVPLVVVLLLAGVLVVASQGSATFIYTLF